VETGKVNVWQSVPLYCMSYRQRD